VAISNLPAAGAGGVTRIELATQTVAGNGTAHWSNADVSGCRAFSLVIHNSGAHTPEIESVYLNVFGALYLPIDLYQKNGYGPEVIAFPVQPQTSQPYFATLIHVFAHNPENTDSDLTGVILCQH
jgi:hypothetical protein